MIKSVVPKKGDPRLVEVGLHCDEWRYPYDEIAKELSFMEVNKPDSFHEALRLLCERDFFYFCYEILNLPVNDPYKLARCYEVQDHQDEDSIYLWFRDGWKSTLITYARTIWRFCTKPESRIAIFSNSLKLAKPHFKLIMQTLETNTRLKTIWHDVFYDDPAKNRDITWSVDGGLYLKQNRLKEPSLSCHGLIDAMPTGLHVDERIIDDIVDLRNVGTKFMMEKVKEAYQMADNLSSGDNNLEQIIGTRYKFGDLYEFIMNLGMHRVSLIPAEVDEMGKAKYDGIPVFHSKEALDKMKRKQAATYWAQRLQTPQERGNAAFKTDQLKYYDTLPKDLRYFIMVDPGTNPDLATYKDLDYTAMWLVATARGRRVYVIDMVRDKIGLKEKWQILKDWYLRYSIEVCGYEEYGNQKDREYFYIKMEDEKFWFTITPLKGSSNSKNDRIETLSEFFTEGKIYFPRNLHRMTRNRGVVDLVQEFIKDEFETFPMCSHDDMLDALARLSDPDMKIYYPQGEAEETGASKRKDDVPKPSPLDDNDINSMECYWGDL